MCFFLAHDSLSKMGGFRPSSLPPKESQSTAKPDEDERKGTVRIHIVCLK
jgi:hypothetical protein